MARATGQTKVTLLEETTFLNITALYKFTLGIELPSIVMQGELLPIWTRTTTRTATIIERKMNITLMFNHIHGSGDGSGTVKVFLWCIATISIYIATIFTIGKCLWQLQKCYLYQISIKLYHYLGLVYIDAI